MFPTKSPAKAAGGWPADGSSASANIESPGLSPGSYPWNDKSPVAKIEQFSPSSGSALRNPRQPARPIGIYQHPNMPSRKGSSSSKPTQNELIAIYRKFGRVLEQEGSLEVTSRPILDVFIKLEASQRNYIMKQNGGIANFLSKCTYIEQRFNRVSLNPSHPPLDIDNESTELDSNPDEVFPGYTGGYISGLTDAEDDSEKDIEEFEDRALQHGIRVEKPSRHSSVSSNSNSDVLENWDDTGPKTSSNIVNPPSEVNIGSHDRSFEERAMEHGIFIGVVGRKDAKDLEKQRRELTFRRAASFHGISVKQPPGDSGEITQTMKVPGNTSITSNSNKIIVEIGGDSSQDEGSVADDETSSYSIEQSNMSDIFSATIDPNNNDSRSEQVKATIIDECADNSLRKTSMNGAESSSETSRMKSDFNTSVASIIDLHLNKENVGRIRQRSYSFHEEKSSVSELKPLKRSSSISKILITEDFGGNSNNNASSSCSISTPATTFNFNVNSPEFHSYSMTESSNMCTPNRTMVLKQMQHRFSAPAPGLNSLLPSFPPKSVPTFSTPAPIFAHHQVTKFTSQSMPMFAPQQHSQLMSSFHPQMHTTLSPQMPSAFNFSSHSVQSPFTMQANTSFTPHSNLAFTPQANHSFVPHSNPTLIPQSKTTCNPHENCFCRLNQQVNPTFPPHPAPKFNAQTLPVLNPSAFNSLPVSSHFPILPSTLPKTATPMPNVTANRPNSLTSVAAITPYISTRPASASSETSFNFPASEAFEFGNHQNQSYKEVGSNEKLRDEKRCKDGTSFTTTFTSPNDVSSFAIGPGLMKVSRGTTTNNISYDDASCNTISIRKKDFSTQVSNIKPSMSTVTVNTVESVFDEESDYYLFTTEKSKTVETCDIGTNTRIIKTKSRAVMTREMKRDHHRSTQTKPTMDYDKLVQRSIKAEMKVLELQAEKCIADHLRTKCDLNLEFNKRKQLHSIDISNEQLTKIEAKFSTMISNIEVEINRINDAYFCNKKKLTASICLADLPLISSNYVKPDIEELFKAVGEKKSSDISNVKVVTQGEIQSEKNKRNSLQSTLDKEVEHALSDIAIPDLDNGAAAARCLDEPKLTTGQKQPKRPSPPPGLSCSLAESFDELQINNPISSVLQDPVGNMLQDPVGMQKAVMARLLQQNPLLATNPQLLQMLVLQEVMGTLAKANVFNAVPVSQTSSTSSCASLGAPSVVQFSANQAEYQSSASASLKSTRRTKQLRRPKPSTIAAMLHSRVQKPKQQELEKASTETELTQPSPSVDKSLPAVDDELESHGIRSSEPTAKRYRSGSVNRVRFRTLSSSCPENQPPSSTTSSRSHSPINSDIFLPEYWQRKERSNSRTPSPSLMRSELDSNWRSPSKSCNVTNWRSPQKRDVMNYRDVMTASGDNNNTQSKSVMERKSPVQALHEEEKEKSCNGVKEAVSRSVNNQSKPAKDDGGWEKVTKRKRNDSKSQSESGGTLPPSRTARESVPSVSKTNFDKLVGKLATKFPTLKRNEAVDLIKEVRKRRKGTLVGMTMSDILKEADSVFATMSTKPGAAKVTNLAPAKSSTSPMMQPSKRAHPLAVNQSSAQVVSSKSKLDINFEQNECTICFETLSSAPLRILDCGHTYHELCIKQWIYGEDATCPVCRNHTLLPEDFPKLS